MVAMTRWLRPVLGLVLVLTMVGCKSGASEEEELAGLVAQAPWLMQVLQHCEAYKQSPGDAERNDLASDTMRLLRGAEVKEMRGDVERLLPTGTDGLALQIVVKDRLRFASEGKKHPIKRGDGVFEALDGVREGDCLVFSATQLEPIAAFQQGKICDTRYYAEFAGVRRCDGK